MAREIATLGVRKIRSRKWPIGTSGATVSVLCERHKEAAPEVGYRIHWNRQRTFIGGERDALLSETIRNKITKSYGRPNHEFWLLVYATEMPIIRDDVSTTLAAALLDGQSHPFDKVWFFFPYHGQDLGHVVPIWAKTVEE